MGDQRWDDQGWQYGVRFGDGSVSVRWSGPTQRDHAIAEAEAVNAQERHPRWHVVVVRHRDGEPWVPTYTPPPPGWSSFGTHLDDPGPLEFSERVGEDGLPMWERPA